MPSLEEEQERFAAQSAQKLLAAQTAAAPSVDSDDTVAGLAHGATTSTLPGRWRPRQENKQERVIADPVRAAEHENISAGPAPGVSVSRSERENHSAGQALDVAPVPYELPSNKEENEKDYLYGLALYKIIELAYEARPEVTWRWAKHLMRSDDPIAEVGRIERLREELDRGDYVKLLTHEKRREI